MIVWLAPSAFAPHRGGVEELTLKLGQHLQRAGHDVLIVTNQHPAHLPRQEVVEGLPVLRISYPAGGLRPARLLTYLPDLAGVARQLDAAGPRPDVVHVVCASTQLDPLAAWSRRRGVPLVITTQGETEMDANQIYQHSVWLRWVLRRRSAQAAALTACSRWTAQHAARIAPAFQASRVILNGVDPEDWDSSPVPDEPVLCAWGRHVPQKGFDLLLRAFPRVRDAVPHARLLLGGDGPMTPELRELASPGVELLGPLDRRGVAAVLARSRVAVVPSRLEPFGIVALEALASGRTVVYSDNGGLAEACWDRGTGVDVNDSEALATALLTALARDPDPKGDRARAAQLAWERITLQYLEVYRQVTSTRS